MDCLKIMGAFCALCIGAGFATGQEVLQFFTVYGFSSIAGIAISLAVFLFLSREFLGAGKRLSEKEISNIMAYYYGKRAGFVLDWFCTFFLCCVFIVMLSGTSAIFSEYFGLPGLWGSISMAVLCFFVVTLGLQRVVDVLGFVGPIIVLFTLTVAVGSLYVSYGNLDEAERLLSGIAFTRSGTSWWSAALLYPSFMFFTLAPILPRIGSTAASRRAAVWGGVLGSLVYHLATLLAVLAMLANITLLEGKLVPMLTLAVRLSPLLAVAFAFIILAGIFTTALPLLYNTCARFAKEKTRGYTALALFLCIFAVIGGNLLPFDALVGIIYGYSGYVGAVLIGILLLRFILHRPLAVADRRRRRSRN